MATIRTAIELQDNFTGVLYQIINSVNLGLSAMEDLQQTMNSPVDTSSIEAARDSINQATIAVQELDAAMQGVEAPTIPTPTAPVDIPTPPVEIPVVWKTDSLEVFTSTGVDRFQQEIQSANNMLNTLNATQERIASTAAQTNLFPESAVADMNNMQSRLQAIQQRIQTIENNPLNLGTDTANAELEQLRGQLNQAVQEQENLNRAVDNMDVEAANQAYLRLSQTVGNTERYIRDNVDEQGRFNQEINEGVANADNLMNTIKGAVAAYATVQTVGKVLDLSDTLTSTTARLDLIVDDDGSVEDLQSKIFESAQASRGSYMATADAISKLGMQASQAFSSNDELIAFTELLNKQFVNAGTSAQGIDSVMLQLTQSMAAGRLQGEELNAVMDNASVIVQDIQRYLQEVQGIDASNIKELASEGVITADVIKNAMFYTADETNTKFESMPKTFSQIWTSFQNTALMAFQPVLNRLNEIANSDAFQQFVDNAIEGLSVVAGVALEIFDLLVSVAGAVADNWSWLSPIIYGVTAALIAYYTALGIYNGIQLVSNGIKAAAAFMEQVHTASLAMEAGATFAATAAQYGFNAALLACPIVWIIVLIIALIALFYAAVAAVNKFAGTSVSATGIICGVFAVAGAFIGNLFVTLINFVIDIFVVLWNFIAAFANFFANVFNDPVGAIARLFFDLVDTILSLLQSLASAIDTIFGSNLAGAVSGWRDSLGGWVDSTFGKGTEVMAKVNASDYHLSHFEYSGAWDAGYSFSFDEGIEDTISNFDPSSLFNTNIPSASDYADLSNYTGSIGDGVGDIADNTGSIKDSLDITEEDLKYLRDIAEQEAINRFTTAEITIEQTNHNTVSGKMDLDGIVSGLTDAANEAVDMIAEGVHA